MTRSVLLLVLFVGCNGDKDGPEDTRTEIEKACDGDVGEPAVYLGQGVGGAFIEIEDGAQVGLDIAPQGGFGVTVQVQTEGMRGDAPATVSVDSEMDGENTGSFTFLDSTGNPTSQLFCKDDGSSTLGAGIAVGFDPSRWNQDNLIDLDGQVADLIVTVTDERGVSASGTAQVTLVVGGR